MRPLWVTLGTELEWEAGPFRHSSYHAASSSHTYFKTRSALLYMQALTGRHLLWCLMQWCPHKTYKSSLKQATLSCSLEVRSHQKAKMASGPFGHPEQCISSWHAAQQPHLRVCGFASLQRMAEDPSKRRLTFQGERTTWMTPVTLNDLLELKTNYPKAPLVMGNTTVGGCFKVCSLGNPNTRVSLNSS